MSYFGIIFVICILNIPNANTKPWKAEPWLGPRLQQQGRIQHIGTLQKTSTYKPGILPNSRVSTLVPIQFQPSQNPSHGQHQNLDITTSSSVDSNNPVDLKFLKVDTLLGTPLSVMIKKIQDNSKTVASTVTENPKTLKGKETSKERKRSTNADDFTPSYRRRQTLKPNRSDGFVLDSLFPTSPGVVNPFFGTFPQNSFANVPFGYGQQEELLLRSGFLNPQLGGFNPLNQQLGGFNPLNTQLGGYNPYNNLGFQYSFAPPFPNNLNFLPQIPQIGGFGQYFPGAYPFGGFGGYNPLFNPYQRLVTVPVPLPVVGQSLGSIVPTQTFGGNNNTNQVEQFSSDETPLQIPLRPHTTFVNSGFQTGRDISNMRPLGSSFAGANPFSQSSGNRHSSPDPSVEVAPFNTVNNNGQQGQQRPFGSTGGRDFSEVFKVPGNSDDDELFPFLRRPQPLRVELPSRQTYGRHSQEITNEDHRREPEPMRPTQKLKVKSNNTVRGEPRSNEASKPIPQSNPSPSTKITTESHVISTTTPTTSTEADRRTKLPFIKTSKKTKSKTSSKNSANRQPDKESKQSPAPYLMGLFYRDVSPEIETENIYPGVLRTPYILGQREEGQREGVQHEEGRGPILHVGDPQLAIRLRDLYGKQDDEDINLPPVYIPPTLCRGARGSIPCDYIETELHDVEGLKEFPGLGLGHQQNHLSGSLLRHNVDFLRGGTFAPSPRFQKHNYVHVNQHWRPMVYTRPKFRLPNNGVQGHFPRL